MVFAAGKRWKVDTQHTRWWNNVPELEYVSKVRSKCMCKERAKGGVLCKGKSKASLKESQVQEVDWISLIEILAKGRFKTSSLPAK